MTPRASPPPVAFPPIALPPATASTIGAPPGPMPGRRRPGPGRGTAVPALVLAPVLMLILVLGLLAASPSPAADPVLPPVLTPDGSATCVAVIDGDTLSLDDGREVRLVGIQAPKLPLGRVGFETWPLAETARAALDDLARGRVLTLGIGGRGVDRHGRTLAHLYRDDGTWLQGAMLAQGLARVYSFADNRALVAEMLALEAAARAAGRGIWADPWYRLRRAETLPAALDETIDSFQLVEGRVLDAAVVRGRGYLNFGSDWKRDFTVSIDRDALRLFEAAGLPIDSLEGRRIRVRGWIQSWNGPLIEATHPEQIEVLGE